jgi:hypothetical protein
VAPHLADRAARSELAIVGLTVTATASSLAKKGVAV